MIFLTKGDFISALKYYRTNEDIIKEETERYKDLYYLRYQKIKSPLDYDIVGYKNGEAVRQIKGRSVYNSEQISDTQRGLESQMEKIISHSSALRKRNEEVQEELKRIEEPLRKILIMRYIQGAKLKDMINKIDFKMNESMLHKYIMKELDNYYEQ